MGSRPWVDLVGLIVPSASVTLDALALRSNQFPTQPFPNSHVLPQSRPRCQSQNPGGDPLDPLRVPLDPLMVPLRSAPRSPIRSPNFPTCATFRTPPCFALPSPAEGSEPEGSRGLTCLGSKRPVQWGWLFSESFWFKKKKKKYCKEMNPPEWVRPLKFEHGGSRGTRGTQSSGGPRMEVE